MTQKIYFPSSDPKFNCCGPSYIWHIANYLEPNTDCDYLVHCIYYKVNSEWYRLAKDFKAVEEQIREQYKMGCTDEDFKIEAYPLKDGIEPISAYESWDILRGFRGW